jgi:hypothetical protein
VIFLHFLRVVTDRESHEATFHFGHLPYTPLKLQKIVFITERKINCNFAKTWGCVWRLRGYNSMLFHINIVMVLHIIIQNYQANKYRKRLQYVDCNNFGGKTHTARITRASELSFIYHEYNNNTCSFPYCKSFLTRPTNLHVYSCFSFMYN